MRNIISIVIINIFLVSSIGGEELSVESKTAHLIMQEVVKHDELWFNKFHDILIAYGICDTEFDENGEEQLFYADTDDTTQEILKEIGDVFNSETEFLILKNSICEYEIETKQAQAIEAEVQKQAIEAVKIKVIDSDQLLSSSLQGYVRTTYDKLVSFFGQPVKYNDDETDGKVTVEWSLEIDGQKVSIYDWKTHGETPKCEYEWSINGFNQDASSAVSKALGLETRSYFKEEQQTKTIPISNVIQNYYISLRNLKT